MARLNWSKAHARRRMQRFGWEPVRGDFLPVIAHALARLNAHLAGEGANNSYLQRPKLPILNCSMMQRRSWRGAAEGGKS